MFFIMVSCIADFTPLDLKIVKHCCDHNLSLFASFSLISQDVTKAAKLETINVLQNKEDASIEKHLESFERNSKVQNILTMLKGRHITSNHS